MTPEISDRERRMLLAAATITAGELDKCEHPDEAIGRRWYCDLCGSVSTAKNEYPPSDNARRIAGENAALHDIAAGALEEVRKVVEKWKKAPAENMCAAVLEAVLERYDKAIKENIK